MKDFINDKPAVDLINEILAAADPTSTANIDKSLERAEACLRGRTISYSDDYLAGLIAGLNFIPSLLHPQRLRNLANPQRARS